jgi:31-O-methyltransferase
VTCPPSASKDNADREARDRIAALGQVVRHRDPSQLWFQVAEIAGEQIYLSHGVRLGPRDVVLDVGANVGVAAAFFITHCGVRLVHSFEPVGPVFEMLADTVKDMPACIPHRLGMGAAPATVPITYYPAAAAMSGLYADPVRDSAVVRTALLNTGLTAEEAEERLAGQWESETLTCELTTVSAFLAEEGLERVDLLKIDVERAELDVLAGIEEQDWPKIRQVALEVHDEQGRCARIERMLTALGFSVATDQDAAMAGTSVRMLYAIRPPDPTPGRG